MDESDGRWFAVQMKSSVNVQVNNQYNETSIRDKDLVKVPD